MIFHCIIIYDGLFGGHLGFSILEALPRMLLCVYFCPEADLLDHEIGIGPSALDMPGSFPKCLY